MGTGRRPEVHLQAGVPEVPQKVHPVRHRQVEKPTNHVVKSLARTCETRELFRRNSFQVQAKVSQASDQIEPSTFGSQ